MLHAGDGTPTALLHVTIEVFAASMRLIQYSLAYTGGDMYKRKALIGLAGMTAGWVSALRVASADVDLTVTVLAGVLSALFSSYVLSVVL